jgi:S1-C subfamily serine protease
MRRSVSFWTMTFLVGYSLLTFAAEWSPIAGKLSKSVVYIENTHGSCTGFVINADVKVKNEDDKDYVLTAAHCDGPELYADQAVAKVVFKDTKKDLMVLETANLDRPALHLANDNPKIGEEVASLGYGWGLERPMFRTAHVSDDNTYIPEDGIGGPFIVIDAAFVGGQSGGPVINIAGEVALIVQRGGQGVGIGVGAEVIKSKVGRYFEKPKVKE